MWPLRASAPATPIMLASAMPAWMNRSGISAWNRSTSHWRVRSPLRHTISGRWRARFTSARPYGLTTVAYGASSGGYYIMGVNRGGELVNRLCRESRGQLDEMAVGAGGQAAQPVGGRGPAHQGLWPAGRRRPGQRGRHRVHVVAIEISGLPAERAPFADDRLDRGDAVDRPIDLGVVGIHEDGQPGQPVVAGEHRRLPQLTLLLLAVADEGEGPDVGPAREAGGPLTFDSPWRGLLPPLWYLVLHLLEANFVTPTLLGRRFTLNPVAIFVSLIFWVWLWGVPGALLSVPILVSVKVVCDRIPAVSYLGELIGR